MARKKSETTSAKKSRRTKSPDPMPSLMFNGGTFEAAPAPRVTPEPPPKKNPTLTGYEQLLWREQNGRRWLFIGVISFMVIIDTIWIFSLKLQISNYRYQGSAEQLFIEENKTNWNTVFEEPPAPPTSTTSQQKIKEVITLLLQNASTTSSSSSSVQAPTTTLR